jgi:alkylhydroperoxidase family enzyme
MRIPKWSPELCPQPTDLVDAIIDRRNGRLLNLDRALLWSEPLARGWNTYLRAVRTELGASRMLRELAICTVALVTGATYEYAHHAPDFLAAGGSSATLDALRMFLQTDDEGERAEYLQGDDLLIVEYAEQMTRNVRVDDALFARMQERFGTTQIVEITAAIATYNMVARFLVALSISTESAGN